MSAWIAAVVQLIKTRFEGDYEEGDTQQCSIYGATLSLALPSSILAYLFGLLIFRRFSSLDNTAADCSSFGYCFFEINRYFLQGLLCRRLPI